MNYPAQSVKSFALLSKGLDAMPLAAKLQHGLGARIVICCTMLPAVVLMKEGKNLFVAWATWPGKQSWWILPQSRIIFQTLPGRCKAEYSATIWMAISLVAFHEFQPCCTFGIILKFLNSVAIHIYISYARCDMIFFTSRVLQWPEIVPKPKSCQATVRCLWTPTEKHGSPQEPETRRNS